jgi:hypothetical protein
VKAGLTRHVAGGGSTWPKRDPFLTAERLGHGSQVRSRQ